MRLYKLLKNYSKKHITAMHMPGHKRHNFIKNSLPYNLDITEIDGFDNLHNAKTILKDCMTKATNLYKTVQSFYLINGSTCGILTAIKSCCDIGDKIIISKNCHKSVFNAIELLNLQHVFIDAHFDQDTNIFCDILASDVKNCLEKNKDAKCVLITSPTYEGVISNIKEIAKVVHKFNIPLIVDEAHGAHLFLENKSAINFGADIVINSLHKTLPSLTQTALLHVCSKRVDLYKIQKNLATFESSSPSYILMASIDECITFMQKHGKKYYEKLQKNLNLFKNKISKLKHLYILGYNTTIPFYDFDKTKIVIFTNNTNISGETLMQKLRENKIELEMCYTNYALAMSTIFDTKKDLMRLCNVLLKIDKNLEHSKNDVFIKNTDSLSVITIHNATTREGENVKFKESINRVCKEFVYVYPPGIPILVPGQVITKEIYEYIMSLEKNNLNVISDFNKLPKEIKVLKNLDK